MEEEILKVIEEFSNYQISNKGYVLNTNTNKILKNQIGSDNYLRVIIKQKGFRIHRLLAIAFVPNPDKKSIVDHIDRNRLNNNIENLRWVSLSENAINRTLSKKNKFDVTGVYFHSRLKVYRASININKKKRRLGDFEKLEDAITARLNAEKKYYGIYSPLYKPEVKDDLEVEFN